MDTKLQPTKQDQLEALHDCYREMTNRHPRYATFERSWYEFVKAGYDNDALASVVHFMLRENRKHDWKYSLALGKLIGDLERFDDLLNEAKAKTRSRVKPTTSREQVVTQFRGRAEPRPEKVCQSVKDVLRQIVK